MPQGFSKCFKMNVTFSLNDVSIAYGLVKFIKCSASFLKASRDNNSSLSKVVFEA